MKRLLLILLVVLAVLSFAQGQRQNPSRRAYKKHPAPNRQPVIDSFTSSTSTIELPCVSGVSPLGNNRPVALLVKAFDPDGDSLSYKYFVTAGKINGEGSDVSWNLNSVPPGSYDAVVEVSDGHGGVAARSIIVFVVPPPNCDPPCPTVTVSCPENVEDGQLIIFKANVSGGGVDLNRLTYAWSVTSETIVFGQGTNSIKVDVTGLAGRTITATVDVGGGPPECSHTASCAFVVPGSNR